MSDSGLEGLRQEIDRIDRDLVRLLNERARVVLEVARRKTQSGTNVFVPDRERQVLENVFAASAGPLKAEHLRSVYREILSSSRSLQRKLRVAYLGPAATFTHQAALQIFGDATEFVPVSSIRDVFLETERGGTDYGVVPVENSTEGSVLFTLDSFIDSELKACAELSMPIVQNLLARCRREEIKTVYSHPQALAQVRGWLAANLPGAELVQSLSTARAAEQAAADPSGAAISPALAAEVYGLEVLESGIQDLSNNITRFLAIGSSYPGRTGQDKTAAIISIKDRVGALHDMMEVFARGGISLSNIQSRPSKRKAWDYYFFIEMEGHAADADVRAALEELERQCSMVKVLGSWPRE
ncbi:MAG: prephenate dehydratase [Chloroflexota bacterium]